MKLLDFIRLIRKHIVLLIAVPLLMAGMTIVLTSKPKFIYSSQTILYTGLATGSSIEMDKTFNYFVTNTAFDNLINIINSRETQQEVAIRLLSQHLLLNAADPKYISTKSYEELKKIVPDNIYQYVVKNRKGQDTSKIKSQSGDNIYSTVADSAESINKDNLFPSSISLSDYELTVRNLTELMKNSDTNFVYKLLNYEHPHYSLKVISSVKVQRIANSDLIKLSFETDDPGICQQTLALFNEICIKNYKNIKENRSDEVVKYFEAQLSLANQQLKVSEDKLLAFNKSNNIINYYEQSKAVAVVKEDMEVDYRNKKAKLAGHDASIKRLEEKLNIQQLVQLKSNNLLDKKKQLGEIIYEIATAEADVETNEVSKKNLPALRKQAERIKNEIKQSVDELYTYQNTTDGLPVSKVLSEWINNVIEAENLKANLMVMEQDNKEFQQQYSIYAPAGANIKRIEREISVAEQGYLEILHGLNLAKLKLQDNELSSNLKAVDLPYYPISPTPTKRKLLIIAAALLGGILVLGAILIMEYFDDTLKNLKKASKFLNLSPLGMGMIAKNYLNPGIENFQSVQARLLEIIVQNLHQILDAADPFKTPKMIVFLSTMEKEGKSVVAGNIAKTLIAQGKKIVYINFSNNNEQLKPGKRFPFVHNLLGYQDPKIDFKSSFLQNPNEYLPSSVYFNRVIKDQNTKVNSYTELFNQNNIETDFVPEYILVELPSILKNNHPGGIIGAADLTVLTCRSNRLWAESDQAALNNILPLTGEKINYILNGVEIQETEALIGELPKKRSWIRKNIKNLLRFQFFSKNQF